jgi:hypothetical protein
VYRLYEIGTVFKREFGRRPKYNPFTGDFEMRSPFETEIVYGEVVSVNPYKQEVTIAWDEGTRETWSVIELKHDKYLELATKAEVILFRKGRDAT